MAVIFAFNIVMWMFQCSLSLMSLNGKAGTVLLFLIYVFIDSIGEFIAHLINGFTLLNGIPDNEIVYDSLFIHYTRLIIVSIIVILIGMIIFSTCGICLLSQFERSRLQ